MSGIIGQREVRGSGVVNREVTYTQENITALGTVTSGTLSTGAVIDDPTMTQGSDATGDVYYRAASGKLTRLATGADGTVLTSTGVGAVPAFEALPGLIKMSTITTLTGDVTSANSAAYVKFWDAASYTPDGGPNNTSTIYFYLHWTGAFNSENNINNIKYLKYDVLGDDITNLVDYGTADNTGFAGSYQTISGAHGSFHFSHYDRFYLPLKPVTLDGSGNAAITVNFYMRNATADASVYWNCNANDTEAETHLQVIEVA